MGVSVPLLGYNNNLNLILILEPLEPPQLNQPNANVVQLTIYLLNITVTLLSTWGLWIQQESQAQKYFQSRKYFYYKLLSQ